MQQKPPSFWDADFVVADSPMRSPEVRDYPAPIEGPIPPETSAPPKRIKEPVEFPKRDDASLLERLADLKVHSPSDYEKVISKLSPEQRDSLLTDWRVKGRPSQQAPAAWLAEGGFEWFICTGRGWGKTLTISNVIVLWDQWFPRSRIALMGRTSRETNSILVTGLSGLLSVCPKAQWNPSRLEVRLPHGSIVTLFSADVAALSLRGFEFNLAVLDEWASYPNPDEIMAALLPTLRLKGSRLLIDTTPRPQKAVVDMLIRGGVMPGPDGEYLEPDPRLIVTTGSSKDNPMLPAEFYTNVIAPWEGTPFGEQEIEGRVILEVPGALFKVARINDLRVAMPDPSDLAEIIVSIDPSLTGTRRSDEVGMVVMARDKQSPCNIYLIADESGTMGPEEWARKALDLYYQGCSTVVYEASSLRELVQPLFANALRPGELMPRLVGAEPGTMHKFARAAEVSPMINGTPPRVFFCGRFPTLESQLTTYDGRGRRSPDRLDALVYGLRYFSGAMGKRYGIDYRIS